MGSQLLTTVLDLFTLCLRMRCPFHLLSTGLLLFCDMGLSMPQLETLVSPSAIPGRTYFRRCWDQTERQLMHITPTPIQITIPNLRYSVFQVLVLTWMCFVPLITAPLLEKLENFLCRQRTFPVPN